MTTPARQAWYTATIFCDVCKATVTRHHRNRHNSSQAHQRALLSYWEWMPSDELFAQFLNSVKGSQLRGFERRLFQHYREEAQA